MGTLDMEKYLQKTLATIKGAGERGISASELTRATQYVGGRQRTEILSDLLLAEAVTRTETPTGARPMIIWRFVKDFTPEEAPQPQPEPKLAPPANKNEPSVGSNLANRPIFQNLLKTQRDDIKASADNRNMSIDQWLEFHIAAAIRMDLHSIVDQSDWTMLKRVWYHFMVCGPEKGATLEEVAHALHTSNREVQTAMEWLFVKKFIFGETPLQRGKITEERGYVIEKPMPDDFGGIAY